MFVYRKAADMLNNCFKGRSLNDVIYKDGNTSIGKLSRILHKAIERLQILEEIYEECLSDFCKNKWLGIIMLSVLIDRQKIEGGGQIKKKIMENKDKIFEMYEHFREKCPNIKNQKGIPKYFIMYGDKKMKKIIKKELRKIISIEKDQDIKELYKIKAEDAKHIIRSRFYKEEKIRIIDKSSCLVVKAGKIKKGNVVVDVCSSPGSKVIFSILQLRKMGHIICIEKDKTRCLTLIKELLKNKELMGIYKNNSYDESTRIIPNENFFNIDTNVVHKDEINKDKINKDVFDKQQKKVYYIKHKDNALFIKIYNCDFFDLNSNDFPDNVDNVYIDPTCSSSGMPDFILKTNIDKSLFKQKRNMSRIKPILNNPIKNDKSHESYLKETSDTATNVLSSEPERICNKISNEAITEQHIQEHVYVVPDHLKKKVERLAVFQKKILKHALDVITSAKTFIYSTCSFFEEENEKVIEKVLKKNTNFYLGKAGKKQFLLKNEKYSFLKKCVRTYPDEHSCRGIFIAKLIRKT